MPVSGSVKASFPDNTRCGGKPYWRPAAIFPTSRKAPEMLTSPGCFAPWPQQPRRRLRQPSRGLAALSRDAIRRPDGAACVQETVCSILLNPRDAPRRRRAPQAGTFFPHFHLHDHEKGHRCRFREATPWRLLDLAATRTRRHQLRTRGGDGGIHRGSGPDSREAEARAVGETLPRTGGPSRHSLWEEGGFQSGWSHRPARGSALTASWP